MRKKFKMYLNQDPEISLFPGLKCTDTCNKDILTLSRGGDTILLCHSFTQTCVAWCPLCTETKSRNLSLCTETVDKRRFGITILKIRLDKSLCL